MLIRLENEEKKRLSLDLLPRVRLLLSSPLLYIEVLATVVGAVDSYMVDAGIAGIMNA